LIFGLGLKQEREQIGSRHKEIGHGATLSALRRGGITRTVDAPIANSGDKFQKPPSGGKQAEELL
jgi:hypothetical protein